MRRILLVFVVGLPLLAGLVALLRLRQFSSRAEEIVAQSLGAATGTRAKVGEVAWDAWAGSLTARGIELNAGGRSLLRGGELQASFHAVDCLFGGGIRPSTLALRGSELALRREDLQRFAAGSGSGAQLRVSLGRVTLELSAEDRLELARASLVASNGTLWLRAERAAWWREGTLLGEASAEFRGKLSGGDSATGRLRLERLQATGQALDEPLELAVDADPERVRLDGTLSFGSSHGALGFGFQHAWSSGAQELTLRPGALQLAEALARFSAAPLALQARIDGQLVLRKDSAAGDLHGPAELDLHGLRSADSGLVIPQLKAAAQLRIHAAGAELSELRVAFPSGELRGWARIAQGELAGDLRGEGLELADLERIAGLAPAGRGRVELGLAGAWHQPRVAARLELAQAALAGLSLGTLSGQLHWDQSSGELAIELLSLRSPERRLSARGASLRWDSAGLAAARAQIQLDRLPLLELYRALGAAGDPLLARFDAVGSGSAELQVERAGEERKLTLGLRLALREASLSGYRFDRGELEANVSIPDAARGLGAGTIGLPRLTLTAAGGRLQLAGALQRGSLDMRIDLADLPLERWPALGTPVSGRIDAHGSLRGSAASTRAGLAVTLRELALAGRTLGSIQLQAELAGADSVPSSACSAGRAALTGGSLGGASAWLICGQGFSDRLRVDLALGNDAARLLRGRVQLDGFALGGLLPLSAAGERLPGRLGALLDFTGGGLSQPERLSGRLRVETLELGSGASMLSSQGPFELHVRDGQLQLEGAALTGWGQSYRLRAAGSLGQMPRLIADGTIEAGMFTRDSQPLLAAFGEVGVQLEWSPSELPAVRGRAELRDVALRVADTEVRNLRGSLALRGEQLHLERLTAELGGGQVTLAGDLQLAGLRVSGYRLGVEAEGVALQPQSLVEVTFDANTQLAWAGSATPKLTGRVKLKRALYAKQLHLAALAALGNMKAGQAGRERVLFDLTIEHDGPLRVRNSTLDGELALVGPERKLRLLGSDQRLGVLGELAVTRGRVSFQGDEYNITRGSVAFADPQRIAPQFELRAVADRRKRPDAQIVLRARGNRDAFALDVRCDAGPGKTTPAPFKCAYTGDQLRCDDWDHLVATYVCRTQGAASAKRP